MDTYVNRPAGLLSAFDVPIGPPQDTASFAGIIK